MKKYSVISVVAAVLLGLLAGSVAQAEKDTTPGGQLMAAQMKAMVDGDEVAYMSTIHPSAKTADDTRAILPELLDITRRFQMITSVENNRKIEDLPGGGQRYRATIVTMVGKSGDSEVVGTRTDITYVLLPDRGKLKFYEQTVESIHLVPKK